MDIQLKETPRGLALDLTLNLPLGLHARPAAKMAREAQKYASEIRLVTDAGEADAKSMLDILSLAPSPNTRIMILANGPDARDSIYGLVKILTQI